MTFNKTICPVAGECPDRLRNDQAAAGQFNLSTHTQLARSNGGLFRHPLIRRVAVAALPISGENTDTPHTLTGAKAIDNGTIVRVVGIPAIVKSACAPATFHAGNNTGMKDPIEQVLLTIAPTRFAVNG